MTRYRLRHHGPGPGRPCGEDGEAGLISPSRTAQWRSSSLNAEPLREATAWMERHRTFWDAGFERPHAHLRRIQKEQAGTTDQPHDHDRSDC